MADGFATVDKAVNSAKELGHLDPSAIWALVCLGLVSYIVYALRQNAKSDIEWQKIRVDEAKSQMAMAEVVSRIADKIGQLQLILLQQKMGGSDGNKGLDQKTS